MTAAVEKRLQNSFNEAESSKENLQQHYSVTDRIEKKTTVLERMQQI